MKKIIIVATAALCLAGNVSAKENPGGDDASDSAFGYLNGKKVVAAAVGLGIVGAVRRAPGWSVLEQ